MTHIVFTVPLAYTSKRSHYTFTV